VRERAAWRCENEYQKYAKLPLVPLLVTPDDQSLQDSTPITDHVDTFHPLPSIHPADPIARFIPVLIEEFGPERACARRSLSGRRCCNLTRMLSYLLALKVNISMRSPIAGPLVGKYGADERLIGLGRLSRLRLESGLSLQLRSMNLIIDA